MDLEALLGFILIIGVFIGLIMLSIGLGAYIYFHGIEIDLSKTIRFKDLSTWVMSLRYQDDVIMKMLSIGLIIIILIPYTRVIASLIWFIYHKDLKFILFTLFVATVLTLSIIGLLRSF
jgi:uncharacterized membrane protein